MTSVTFEMSTCPLYFSVILIVFEQSAELPHVPNLKLM